MLEGLAAWVLNTYVGEYVENLNTDQLSIALLSGAVELENLPLKKDALNKLGLPLVVKSGFIGKITLQIPLRRMHSEPWVISIEKLYLVAGPLQDFQYDEEKERASREALKMRMLNALEEKMQIQKSYKQDSSWFSYGTSVLANILENLQLNVTDVHIRYEDEVTNPGCPFAFGVVIKTLSAQSTDGNWMPKFVSRNNVEMMHKLVDLNNFSMYLDTNTTLVGDLPKDQMADSLQREMYVSSITEKFKEHEHILSPVSAKAKMKRFTTPLPLRKHDVPRNTMDLTLESMAFAVSEDQYRCMVLVLREFDKYEKSKRYRKWKPSCPLHCNARKWWQFAIQARLSDIQERNRRLTATFLSQRCKDVVTYTQLYVAVLRKEVLTATMKSNQTRIEAELSFDELKILREVVYRNLKRKGLLSKSQSPEPESTSKPGLGSPEAGKAENQSVLQRWFPGWGGWYSGKQEEPGTSSTGSAPDQNVGEPPPSKISKSELEQELHDVLEDILEEGEDDKSVLKRDAVFAKLNFCLNTGSFKVLGNSSNKESGDREGFSIMELECSSIEMMFESRPRTAGLTFGLSVGGLRLMDKLTENTLFPCLVGSQNKDRFGPKRQVGISGMLKTPLTSTLHELTDCKLFALRYDKHPFGTSANYRFSIHTEPLDIVYNRTAFQRVREVFSTRNIFTARKTESAISAARRKYETLKRQTQAEVKNSITQLMEGSEKVKRWEIQLDIAAPQIILPEKFTGDNTNMIVLDLGHLKFHNTRAGSPIDEADPTNEDEFLTPMSTPPNELADDSQQKSLNIDNLAELNLSEDQLLSKLYEKYTLELTDLQVMCGRMKDNWRHVNHRTTTPLHLVDRFTISLQLERRLLYTVDPQYPTLIASGTMPSLTIHVNETKIQGINACLQSLKSTPAMGQTSVNQSASNQSLSESASGMALSDLGEVTQDMEDSRREADAAKKLKELQEKSQLLSAQFSINMVSMEIHSRDRPIAELQVSNVRTSLTKHPYDTSVSLTVHSLLIVDALQTYGKDFELLMASHKNITLDSASGSIRDSATTSPIAVSPRSPPGSPMETLVNVPTPGTGSLATIQDMAASVYQSLINSVDKSPKVTQTDPFPGPGELPTPEQNEALISVELEMYNVNSPSNTNPDGPLTIANFNFNNLDIIANQETVVEIVSFLKRVVPRTKRSSATKQATTETPAMAKSAHSQLQNKEETRRPQFEVTADFNRLSILLMRLEDSGGSKVARKVAMATMTGARLQATITSQLTMTGSLGGFHVFDITPEAKRHHRLFSMGQDFSHSGETFTVFNKPDMYKTCADESMFEAMNTNDSKAFMFEFSKPLKRGNVSRSCSPCVDTSTDDLDKSDCIRLTLKVASLCYTHAPATLQQLSQCVSEFKEYKASVATSLKNVANEVAKGMVAKRVDANQTGLFGSQSSLDMFAKYKSNISLDRTEADYFETVTLAEDLEKKPPRIILDASFESPVIVVPKSASSPQVLVAHLGHISLSNRDDKGQVNYMEEVLADDTVKKPDRIFLEVRKMNLYAVDIDKNTQANKSAMDLDGSFGHSININDEVDVPIIFDTTIQVIIDHTAGGSSVINASQDVMLNKDEDSFLVQDVQPLIDMKARIQTPLKVVLQKYVYEQILQTSDYMSSVEAQYEQISPDVNTNASTDSFETADNASVKSEFQSFDSTKSASISSSVTKSPFVCKKFRLEVPVFNVELRGDFDDGQQGLVDLKLHTFLLDLVKDNSATTKVDVSLKSIVMEDLLQDPDSEHRQIVVSKGPPRDDFNHMKPREFMSHSCPDNAIVAPIPMMPGSLPSSFHNNLSNMNKPIFTRPLIAPFSAPRPTGRGRHQPELSPCTPPPSPHVSRSLSHDELMEEHLVHIDVLLVDKASPEYKEKYNETKRFINVDFNCLEVKINLQTWVVLLDFLGLGAKVHDMDKMAGRESSMETMAPDPDVYVQQVVNSEVTVKMEKLSVTLNKEEYEFSRASVSKLNAHAVMRDENLHLKGQLGEVCVLDLSPSGQLYRERFLTVGEQALEFEFFKFGVPDPWLKRDYDMKMKLRMSSVRYTHTNKFQMEMLGFIQHFLQLQDVLGRMRAASAGKKINEAAFHQPRLLLDVEAGSPIILIPHSSKTTDVLVADLGTLSVKNCFKFDGDSGTFSASKMPSSDSTADETSNQGQGLKNASRTSSQRSVNSTGGIVTSRSLSKTDVQPLIPQTLTQSMFDELLPPRSGDPMTDSIYGGLEADDRNDDDIFDPTEDHNAKPDLSLDLGSTSPGTSVDPLTPVAGPSTRRSFSGTDRSPFGSNRSSLNIPGSDENIVDESRSNPTSPLPGSASGIGLILSPSGYTTPHSPTPSRQSVTSLPSLSDADKERRNVFAYTDGNDDSAMEGKDHKCLLDVLEVKLSDMDLFSAERVEKRHYKGTNLLQDLEFPSCVIQRKGNKLLREKCLLDLLIERNLEGDISHTVPDIRVQGALSSVYCCLDIAQYKLIRGLLDHNLGEKFENFKKDLMTHMQDPKIQTVLSGEVWTVISMAIDLHNVTLELLTSHEDQGSGVSECSLARLDFIRSRLSYDNFSDQSKETDLVSHEILVSDTRFRDVAINQRSSVFERMLQPVRTGSPDGLQLELHHRVTQDGTVFKVIINNMKLLCNFEWMMALKDFISTKPEDPFVHAGGPGIGDLSEDSTVPVSPTNSASSSVGSRTTSPLTTSGGICTKRGPHVIEQPQTDPPFELKLNITETEFVVVENLAALDTNAVILKSTAVLSYKPRAPSKLLSCNLQSLEVFSCCLGSEEDTALSIVDKMSVSIELNANPLPLLPQTSSMGLNDSKVFEPRQLLLEVGMNTVNVRLSYEDMRLFLAIMDSLPKTAFASNQKPASPTSDIRESHLDQLQGLGYTREDCKKALKHSKDNMNTAAMWLVDNAQVVKPSKEENKLTAIEVNVTAFCVCLIDDCQDADVPLVELSFHGVSLKYEPGSEGKTSFKLTADYYNRILSGWEPLIEQWKCHAQWKNYKSQDQKLAVEISASDVLCINVTKTLLDLYNSTKDKWTEDYNKQKEIAQKEGDSSSVVRRRQLFTPYAVRNHTGSPLWFIPVTVSPLQVGGESDAYIQATEWLCVPPNEEMPFNFHKKEKIRHKKSESLRVNQIIVKVDGWQRLSPLSVDKVGTYFRNTDSDLSKLSLINKPEQHTRIVFDIEHEGSARKVITLRTALVVHNRLDEPVELQMVNPFIPDRYENFIVSSNQKKSIPLPYINAKFWVRPSDWPVEFCCQPIEWQSVTRPGDVTEHVKTCNIPNSSNVYRFGVAIRHESYPEIADQGSPPLPGHSVIIVPPVSVVNLLPVEMHYYFRGTDISGDIKPGKEAQLPAADTSKNLEFGVCLENFPECQMLTLPPGTRSYKVKMRLFDTRQRLLELIVSIYVGIGGSVKLSVMAPYWLVNKCGLPLVFRQDGCEEAAGQFDENEIARIVSPLMFSFSRGDFASYLCEMRIGKFKHGPDQAVPMWCKGFDLESVNVRKLNVVPKIGNRPDWLVSARFQAQARLSISYEFVQIYDIGIGLKAGKGQFRNTTIVTFSPRYQIDNMSDHKVAIAQRHFTITEALLNPDSHLTALPKCKMPFHWPRQDLDQLLCVKLLDVPDCNWSGGFRIDTVDSFHLNMRDGQKNSLLLKVEIYLQGQTLNIIFSDAEETPPPFRIDNFSEVSVLYYQTKTEEDRLRAYVRPNTCLPYAWDEPTLDHHLTLSVMNGTSASYDLDAIGEGQQLLYENYHFICATATLSKPGEYSDGDHQNLVLDCEHSYIKFRRKEFGRRSQLWRFTSTGMLENEGLSHPLEPGMGARSGQRFVLDFHDIALQPGKTTPLEVKKANERATRQTWRFKDGMLCSAMGNFCVQAISEDGLQEGAIAILGPAPPQAVGVATHMRMCQQKLHPGSGCLTVRTQMDGPVRVVQINDISHRKMVRQECDADEDWEIYEESLNHKTNEKRRKPQHRNLEIDVNLKGGLGISLVNSVPEELLYVSLKNINLMYRQNARAVTFEMSVGNIQADNQMFSAYRTAALYVTPPARKDIVENTHALVISAHKIPNMGWNAEIFKHLIISMKKLTLQLEEELLWKLVQFAGAGQGSTSTQDLEDGMDDLYKTLSGSVSVKSKRYYFGVLKVKPTCLTLSIFKPSIGLSKELKIVKRNMGVRLISFEDAKVDLSEFKTSHQFETKEFYMNEMKKHYSSEMKGWGKLFAIIGSTDILGNPAAFMQDVSEGITGLVEDTNVTGFAKGIFHGVSNSTAKFTGALSEGLSTVHRDDKHNTKRHQIRSSAKSSGGQLMSGIKGFGHGLFGGVKSVLKPLEGVSKGGLEGFGYGLYEGITGVVTKPVAGVLDLASGVSNAVRDVSKRSSHCTPDPVREPRCCHGPGGLLPPYSLSQAESQSLLYQLNEHKLNEIFISLESVRAGRPDSLYVMITSHQVFFLRKLEPHAENIILQVKHGDYSQCRNFEKDGRYYVEILRKEVRSSIPHSSNKRPQIRCDRKDKAQRVAQQITYAKNLYDDQKMRVVIVQDQDDQGL